MRINAAEFVKSAAAAADFPGDGAPEIALVGRSNVGKSSLINALVRTTLARTSRAPGKTRLVNFYRITPASLPAFYLVDLPGYGYARGGAQAGREFRTMTAQYFGGGPSARRQATGEGRDAVAGILLAVDARHPGLPSDLDAWRWAEGTGRPVVIVATKIDKLTRAERARAEAALETSFTAPVVPVSAVTGEGLDRLWKLINRLTGPSR